MQEAIALLAPSLIALDIYNHLHRSNLSTRKLIFSYGVFVVCINLCTYLIALYLFNVQEILFSNKEFITYIITAGLLAFIMPFVVNLIENTIALEVKKNVKK